ncbi:META domain-containing protein [Alteromonas sp. CI.11.F.A3]|uniref:META domain-containing protein n=1 Tax=Alteromonas sp. CI.11.F.A3 TaxID=3079555 RepID=UPI002941CB05|nr:META domain-containing protein [Alteromonas sp. CI.11.F.A3]WOI37272.1 META domain-containing protein [Alteromonas sp. CI.11.F.A3]
MPSHFRNSLFIVLSLLFTVAGCSNSPTQTSSDGTSMTDDESAITLTGTWQVESIDMGGIIDSSMMTVELVTKNRISGFTGCNQFSGILNLKPGELAEGEFATSKLVTTRRACVGAMSAQEQRFVKALEMASRYEIQKGTWLVIYDNAGKQRLKLIRMSAQDTAKNEKMDAATTGTHQFNCATAGNIVVRFLSPETIKLSEKGNIHILQRTRSASGARYIGMNTEFWNKGNSAVLSLQNQSYSCSK